MSNFVKHFIQERKFESEKGYAKIGWYMNDKIIEHQYKL